MSVESKRPAPSVLLPVLVLLAGVMLLLFNLDALPEGAGWRLLLISPLILVMVGLQIVISRLLGGQVGTAVSLAVIGMIGLLGLAFVALGPTTGSAAITTTSSSSPVAGVSTGNLRIDAVGSHVSVIFGDIGSDLYRARLSYSGPAPKVNYSSGDLRITSANRYLFDWGRASDQYTLTLARSVPWSIAVNGVGSTTSVELLAGQMRDFTLNGVGSNAELSLGSPSGTVPIEVSGIGAKLAFTVPADVQYRARAEGVGATVVGVSESGGWTSTTDRYDVIGKGVGTRIEVRNR